MGESLPALALLGIGDFLAGLYLGRNVKLLSSIPGLIAILPVIMGLRGNVYSIGSAKFSTILHVSGPEGLRTAETRRVLGSLLTSTFLLSGSTIILLFLYYSVIEDVPFKVARVALIIYSSKLIMFPVTIGFLIAIMVLGFHYGLDPDHYGIPLIMGFADLLSVFLIVLFVPHSIGPWLNWALIAVILAFVLLILLLGVDRGILKISIIGQVTAILLDLLAGILLERNIELFSARRGLLYIVPIVNSMLGGVGGIMVSKYSTGLNLGSIEDRLLPGRSHAWLFSTSLVLAAFVFPVLGLVPLLDGVIGLYGYLVVVLLGLVNTSVAWFLAHFVTTSSHRVGIDPDLLGPSLITSSMDVLGVLSLIGVLLLQ